MMERLAWPSIMNAIAITASPIPACNPADNLSTLLTGIFISIMVSTHSGLAVRSE
jgi:hypothetical protein